MTSYLRTLFFTLGFLSSVYVGLFEDWTGHIAFAVVTGVINFFSALLSVDDWPSGPPEPSVYKMPDGSFERHYYYADGPTKVVIVDRPGAGS